jgi:hypothetical protein
MDDLFEESERLVVELMQLIDLPAIDSERVQISDTACSLALEHWHAVRSLLELGLLPSALVVHRSQFEALVRSVWLAYAASDAELAKLTATLDLESEQAAKNIPTVHVMMQHILEKAPAAAYSALSRFKEHNWKALNSYTHAGIHPLRRHADGYPEALLKAVLCNANGVGVMSCMQAVVLSGVQAMQKQVLEIAAKYARCTPRPAEDIR